MNDEEPDRERLRRWRLVLGGEADTGEELSDEDEAVDEALAALYDARPEQEGRRAGDLGSSAPRVARWLGDIRRYFPSPVVQVMQRDAIERLGLAQLLMEPELLGAVEPDVHLVSTLLSLNDVMPEEAKQTAREVIRRVVTDLEQRLAERTRAAVTGALDRASRSTRPRHADIDWNRTVRANLKHYSPELGTIVPDRLIGYGRRGSSVQRDIVLAIDQSGVDGRVGGVREPVRRSPRVDPLAAHQPGRVRHRGGGPDRAPATTRSTYCSAPSSAAAPTSTARWPTASS